KSNREQLLTDNKKIIESIATELKKYVSADEKQPLIIMVSNPVDLILNHFIESGNFNKKKTIGSGNWLDTNRFKDMISRETGIDPKEIDTIAVAQHGAKIVYLISKTSAQGKSLQQLGLTESKIKEIQDKATNGAQEIIGLLAVKSTTYGPALSILDLIQSYVFDKKQLLSASTYLDGEYGVHGYTLGVPIILGKNGVEEIKLFDLSPSEKEEYKNSYEFVLSLEV
ncbi:MAG: hypothetical protein LBC92_04815, partial [Rickettsiales bacterium]|nr:hypothetical protein [Rickettsiales bacterium]